MAYCLCQRQASYFAQEETAKGIQFSKSFTNVPECGYA